MFFPSEPGPGAWLARFTRLLLALQDLPPRMQPRQLPNLQERWFLKIHKWWIWDVHRFSKPSELWFEIFNKASWMVIEIWYEFFWLYNIMHHDVSWMSDECEMNVRWLSDECPDSSAFSPWIWVQKALPGCYEDWLGRLEELGILPEMASIYYQIPEAAMEVYSWKNHRTNFCWILHCHVWWSRRVFWFVNYCHFAQISGVG